MIQSCSLKSQDFMCWREPQGGAFRALLDATEAGSEGGLF